MRPRRGDIIVRTGKPHGSRTKLGTMMKVNWTRSEGRIEYAAGWSIDKKHYRIATEEETKAYENGQRSVFYVGSTAVDNYSVI